MSGVLRVARFVGAVTILCVLGSCTGTPIALVADPSPPPVAGGTLEAGFAKVDITPPPGAGLMGWGPEGYAARGHRQRLFARAMVLQDKLGQRLAFVGLDLGEVPAYLHRKVAEQLMSARTGIGADRLVLAATHTHSGPSHYFAQPAFDELGSDVAGFDQALADTLVARAARAVRQALDRRGPARMAWGLDSVWGATRIRSFPAYASNPPGMREALRSAFPPARSLDARHAGVDATWGMLRVDVRNRTTGEFERTGALSIFAIHGTVMSSGLELYDSDILGRVSQLLEARINPGSGPDRPLGTHLFFNGGEGDVSPDYEAGTRCPTPMLVRDEARKGPQAGPPRTRWAILPRDRARRDECERLAIADVERLASSIVPRAAALYETLGAQLSDTLTVGRVFQTVHVDDAPPEPFCSPREGVAATLGAEDGYARVRWNWTLLGADSAGSPALPRAARSQPKGCHGVKRVFLGGLQGLPAGRKGIPDAFQLALVRIGAVTLIAIPGEPTTHASWIARRAVATALRGESSSADSVLTIGLANGYIHYVASPAEYPLQYYEGAATQLGPQEIVGMAALLAGMAPQLGRDATQRPDTVFGYVRQYRRITGWDYTARAGQGAGTAKLVSASAWADSVEVTWTGPHPAEFYGAAPTELALDEERNGTWALAAWDNLPEVSVWVRGRKDGGGDYRLRWLAARAAHGPLRFRIASPAGERCWAIDGLREMTC